MGYFMGVLGTIGGAIVAPYKVLGAAILGSEGKAKTNYGERPDYSEELRTMSENNKEVSLLQIGAMRFASRQQNIDREMQRAASLELSLEKFDTDLQVSKLSYLQGMTHEENQHQEIMFQTLRKQRDLESGHGFASPDLPPPPQELE